MVQLANINQLLKLYFREMSYRARKIGNKILEAIILVVILRAIRLHNIYIINTLVKYLSSRFAV